MPLTIRSAPRNSRKNTPGSRNLISTGQAYLQHLADLQENRTLLETEPADSELAQMAQEELARLEAEEKRLGQ